MNSEKKTKSGLLNFLNKLDKRWDKFLLPSKFLFVVAILEEILMVIVGVLKLIIPREACFDEANNLNLCPEYYMVEQSFATFAWNIFFFISVFHGLFYGNIYELYAAMLLACCMTTWSIWRFIEPYPNKYLDYIFLISTLVAQFCYFVLSPMLYREYAWVIYRKAGADQLVCAMYRRYLQWSCFQKLDAFFGLFAILLSGKGIYTTEWTAGLDWAMLVLVLISLGVGYFAVKKEIVSLTIFWICLFPILPACIIFKFIDAAIHPTTNYTDIVLDILFRVCGSLFLISRIILCIFTVIVYRNYGKGLLQLDKNRKELKVNIEEEDSEGEFGYLNYSLGTVNDPNDWDQNQVKDESDMDQ